MFKSSYRTGDQIGWKLRSQRRCTRLRIEKMEPLWRSDAERLAYLKLTPVQRSQWVRDLTTEGVEPHPGPEKGKEREGGGRACYGCGKYDHLRADCPNPKSNPRSNRSEGSRGPSGTSTPKRQPEHQGRKTTVDLLATQLQDETDKAAGDREALKDVVADMQLEKLQNDVRQSGIDRIRRLAEEVLKDNAEDEFARSVLEQTKQVATDLVAAGVPEKGPPKPPPPTEEEIAEAKAKAKKEEEFQELVDKEFAEVNNSCVPKGRMIHHYEGEEFTFDFWTAMLCTAYCGLWTLMGFFLLETFGPTSMTVPVLPGFFLGFSGSGGYPTFIKWMVYFAWVGATWKLFFFSNCLKHCMEVIDSYVDRESLEAWLRERVDLRPDAQSQGVLKHWFIKPLEIRYTCYHSSLMTRKMDEFLASPLGSFVASYGCKAVAVFDHIVGQTFFASWRGDYIAMFRGQKRTKQFTISGELAAQILNPNVLIRGASETLTTARIREVCKGIHSVNLSRYMPVQGEYLIQRTAEFCFAVWKDQERESELIPFPTIPVA